MRRPTARVRAGITLTEILISILIMGVGMISLATLFPLGLLRIREANRNSRSTLLGESGTGDLSNRNLMISASFTTGLTAWYPWAFTGPLSRPYDSPLTYDPSVANNPPANIVILGGPGPNEGVSCKHGFTVPFGAGLPVCYDPVWRSVTGVWPNYPGLAAVSEARFASGLGFVRPQPGLAGDTRTNPSAYGLQRLTNLPVPIMTGGTVTGSQWGSATAGPLQVAPWNQMAGQIQASQDDMVFQNEANPNASTGQGSPIVPDVSTGQVMADWSFSWLFTGQQSDCNDGTVYDGNIVVFHNRPFALDSVNSPFAGAILQPAGEVVVEAIFAYGSSVVGGYSANDRVVLLRWPSSMPDPDVRVGGWIADVTYERFATSDIARFQTAQAAGQSVFYPGQRCNWYRVVKRATAEDEVAGTTPAPVQAGFRRMTLMVGSPLRARTLLAAGGTPIVVNAAFVSPYVVNVFPKVFYAR